jgi:peptidoglycan/xylan/chitin deacetylase (PgdA/CDA1 family)
MNRGRSTIVLGALLVFASVSLATHASDVERGGKDLGNPSESLTPLELAITVDDLPGYGASHPGMNRFEIVRKTIAALKSADDAAIYGFSNGSRLDRDPNAMGALRTWVNAGYFLGNHTYSHADLGQVSVENFIADIEKMEPILAFLSSAVAWPKMFRYPFLSEGDTLEKRNAVRNYVRRKGYDIAQVTVNYEDWAWIDAYTRCAARHDEQEMSWLRAQVVTAARRELRHAQTLARRLIGRDIKHILVLHLGAFNAVSLPDVLKAFKADGVQFISLQSALGDEIYGLNPNVPMSTTLTFLAQLALLKGIADPSDDRITTVEKLQGMCIQ